MSRSLEEASATIGATRLQTFWHVTLPSLRGAIVSGALLTFARAVGEFGSTILVSGNLAGRTQTAPLYIFAKFNEGRSRLRMRLRLSGPFLVSVFRMSLLETGWSGLED